MWTTIYFQTLNHHYIPGTNVTLVILSYFLIALGFDLLFFLFRIFECILISKIGLYLYVCVYMCMCVYAYSITYITLCMYLYIIFDRFLIKFC